MTASSADQREAVDAASRKTETELWLVLSTRLQENYARMRQNGVTIDSDPAPAIVEALRSAAATAQRAWCSKSGPSAPKSSMPSKRANHSRSRSMTAMLATQWHETPADQFSSASQTRILDLNCSKLRSNIAARFN